MARKKTSYGRRQLLRSGATLGTIGIASVAGCTGTGNKDTSSDEKKEKTSAGSKASQMSEKLQFILPEGEIDIPFWLAGKEQGFWKKQQVNLAPQVSAFGEYARALTSGSSKVGSVNASIFNDARNKGQNLRLFGGHLKQINGVFVRPDSDIESPADLAGKKVGVPYWSSGTTKTIAAMIYDKYDIHLKKDTQGKSAAPSVLWELLVEKKELDAIVEFTGYTVKAKANPDKARQILSARQHWKEKTGHPAMVVMFAARNDWIQSNSDVARRILDGWENTTDWGTQNLKDIYKRYGLLAGIENQKEFEVVINEFENDNVLLKPQKKWGKDLIDAQFKLYKAMHEAGFTKGVPDRESVISHSELQDM